MYIYIYILWTKLTACRKHAASDFFAFFAFFTIGIAGIGVLLLMIFSQFFYLTPLNTCGKKYFSDIPTQVNRNAASDFLKILVNLRCGMDAKCPFYYMNDLRFLISSSQTTCGMNFFCDIPTQVNRNAASDYFNFFSILRFGMDRKYAFSLLKCASFFYFTPLKYLRHFRFLLISRTKLIQMPQVIFFTFSGIKCMGFVGNISFIINMQVVF